MDCKAMRTAAAMGTWAVGWGAFNALRHGLGFDAHVPATHSQA